MLPLSPTGREHVITSVDELLHAWYRVVQACDEQAAAKAHTIAHTLYEHTHTTSAQLSQQDASDTVHSVLASCCASLFASYVRARGSVQSPPPPQQQQQLTHDNHHTPGADEEEDEEDDYSESLTLAQLDLMARLGRSSAVSSCAVLHQSLCQLGEALWPCVGEATSTGAPRRIDTARLTALYDPLWFVWTLMASVIADPSEGEQASIPACFAPTGRRVGEEATESRATHQPPLNWCHTTTTAEVQQARAQVVTCSSEEALVQLMQSALHFTPFWSMP